MLVEPGVEMDGPSTANEPEAFCFMVDRWASPVEIIGGWELEVDRARRPCSRLTLGFETVDGRDGDVNTLRARGLVGVVPRVMVADGIFTATEESSVVAVTDEIESGDGRSGDDLIGFFSPDDKTTELDEMVRLGRTLLDPCLHKDTSGVITKTLNR